MTLLRLEGVGKRFGPSAAVEDVSLAVDRGEFCVFLGPSGCGKSTLLRLVAGLERPTTGRIVIDGRDVDGVDPAERDVAMVFQSYALYPHMTVRENLEFPLVTRRVPDREARVREAADLLRIGDLLGRLPRELSGGQRQRVAIGRAIVRRPRLFLFDEPLSNLDAQLRAETRVELARLHRRLGATILYVTHDQVEAMTLGTRVVLLRDGRVEQEGPPDQLYRHPRTPFVARFIGTPPMNLLKGQIRGGLFRGAVEWPVPGPDGPALIGVRPEDLRLGEGPWEGAVDVVENLGAEAHVHVRVGDTLLTARVAPEAAPVPGARVRLAPRTVQVFPGEPRAGSGRTALGLPDADGRGA
jgi:multiple sugar transport system ATP-binding protein